MGKKVWYNYWQPRYESDEPSFYRASSYDWTDGLLEVLPQIKAELNSIIESRDGLLTGHYADEVNSSGAQWHTLAFKQWGIKVKSNLKLAPTLDSWLSQNPRILSSSVNILNPGAAILEHQGDTNAIVRCHIGIEVPGEIPKVGFSVNGEDRSWIKDDFLIFRDALSHKAWNHSDTKRVILVVDYLLDGYQGSKTSISINVRAFQLFQLIVNKWKSIKSWSKWMHRLIFINVKILLYILLPLQKITGVLRSHS